MLPSIWDIYTLKQSFLCQIYVAMGIVTFSMSPKRVHPHLDYPQLDYPHLDLPQLDFDYPQLDYPQLDYPHLDSGTFSERKTGLRGKSSQTGGVGLTQTHFLMSTYQVIFGMPK